MKKVLVLLAMVLGTINMYAQDYDLEGLAKALNEYYIDGGFHCGLAVAVKGNYCGYINKKGQLVIPFNYISAEEFRDNQAKVVKEGSEEYFFIDKNGNKIASPSGLFPDSKRINGKYLWGYVDGQGHTVIQYQYKDAKDFREGLARVQSEDGSYYFINNTGGALTDRHNEIAEYASDGFIRYKPNVMPNNATPKWGFLNRFGRRTIPAKYYDAGDFSEGIAYVEELIGEELWCGFIDNNGNKVHRTKYNIATYSRFKDGYIVARDESGKYGYINRQGQPLTSFMFDYAEDFSEGLARVSVGDKWGFVDKQGNSTFNPPASTKTAQSTNTEADTIYVTETLPSFVGGQTAMVRWLSEHLQYPEEALNKGIKGRVIASFCVEKDGTISNVEIVKSVHPLLDNETIRLLKTMPKWIPGTQDGIPVRAKFSVPLTYNFTEELN